MRKTLQKISRTIQKAGYRFTAVIKRALHRRSRPAAKPAAGARLGTPVVHEHHGAYRTTASKRQSAFSKISPVFSNITKAFRKRSVKLVAAGGAAVVIVAVVLAVVLSSAGNAAVAQAGQSQGTGEQSALASDPQQTISALPTIMPTETSVSTLVPTTAPEESLGLVPGCHDPRIMDVQEKLMELGYMGMDEPTDYYGPGTKYALQLFQRKHSLQIDGILGDQTMNTLFSADAMPYTVKVGDKGTDVANIQERLKELKYFSGEVTGDFGDRTEAAVKSFQKRNGLYADGNVGEQTLEVLFSDDAKPAGSTGGGGTGGGSTGGGSTGGGSHGGGTTIADWEPDAAKADALIAVAESMLGKKYVRGGKGPETFDCSGLVYYCLNQSGYSIGYKTSGGWASCSLPKVTKLSDMRRGDIVCFKGHVGIYLGNGQMIDASSTEGKVRISKTVLTSSYWKKNFICARRLF